MTELPWVIVPCSGSKRPDELLTAELRYTGPLYRLALSAALQLTSRDRVRILSARYGLLDLDDPTQPYDLRVDALAEAELQRLQRHVHAGIIDMLHVDKLAKGLQPYSGRDFDALAPVIALVPSSYVELLRWSPTCARRLVTPLEGSGGIGVMRQRLAMLRDGTLAVSA